MGLGAFLIFLGVALFSSRLVSPLVSVLGWPATKLGGAAGVLARDNSRRNTQRTASTASALMIGLALVTLVADARGRDRVDVQGRGQRPVEGLRVGLRDHGPEQLLADPRRCCRCGGKAPGVEAVGNVRTGEVRTFGKNDLRHGESTPTASRLILLTWKDGSQQVLANLGDNGAFVDDGYANDHNLTVGSPIALTFPSGEAKTFADSRHLRPADRRLAVRQRHDLDRRLGCDDRESPEPLLVRAVAGDESAANQQTLEKALEPFPNAKVQTRQQFIDNQISGLSAILNILYVLLALSIVVSLFGIVNTLVLTVFERTREIGMLRAIGMTRRQVRRMIRHESVITALIGAAIGIVLGIVLAALLIARVDFIDFTFPWLQVIVFTIAAILVGIVAAIFPARRAAKLNPLEALHYE